MARDMPFSSFRSSRTRSEPLRAHGATSSWRCKGGASECDWTWLVAGLTEVISSGKICPRRQPIARSGGAVAHRLCKYAACRRKMHLQIDRSPAPFRCAAITDTMSRCSSWIARRRGLKGAAPKTIVGAGRRSIPPEINGADAGAGPSFLTCTSAWSRSVSSGRSAPARRAALPRRDGWSSRTSPAPGRKCPGRARPSPSR